MSIEDVRDMKDTVGWGRGNDMRPSSHCRCSCAIALLHSPQLLCTRRACRRGSVGINMPKMPMPPDVKAMRAQHRMEDTAYFNQQLDAAIIHKSNCLKQVQLDNRKAAALDMHCVAKWLHVVHGDACVVLCSLVDACVHGFVVHGIVHTYGMHMASMIAMRWTSRASVWRVYAYARLRNCAGTSPHRWIRPSRRLRS